jgi:dolichol-phosphate mannosyltransferase
LSAQGGVVREILVVDGGSADRTRAVANAAAARDPRIRFIEAPALPPGWNGKAWNLETGLHASDPRSRFIVTIDADVRPGPQLIAALCAHADRCDVRAFSVATRQRVADGVDAWLHPSMLATLVYRFGIPGSATSSTARVQANGQCFIAERALLLRAGAIAEARDSRSEDVTIARVLAAAGTRVGFYEADDLTVTAMYASWSETLRNWPRSLPMVDRRSRATTAVGLLEVLFVQALPPWIAAGLLFAGTATQEARVLLDLQFVLIAMRIGILTGMRRAYERPPIAYWLSPLPDLGVALLLLASALSRRHTWRGRTLVAERA